MVSLVFDHVNVRTGRLKEMVQFYGDVLGLHPGERPPFGFGGAWLYADGQAVVHLVEVADHPQTQHPRIEHFAFRSRGLPAFLKHLKDRGVSYELSIVPGLEIRQVNIHDPDGNHLHVDFDATEPVEPA